MSRECAHSRDTVDLTHSTVTLSCAFVLQTSSLPLRSSLDLASPLSPHLPPFFTISEFLACIYLNLPDASDCTLQLAIACLYYLHPLSSLSTMTSPAGLTFEELLANLSLGGEHTSPPSPPRSTLPTTPPIATPSVPSLASPSHSTTVYRYESPTKSGVSTSWATAGTATQGVNNARVFRVQKPRKKKTPKPRAYVVFIGVIPGVYFNWSIVDRQVSGVSNAIQRGYPTERQAYAAYLYACPRGWTRSTDPSAAPTPISHLPTPSEDEDTPNPLHDTEDLDGTWYVVYRGIQPGVYHSLLEASLNTTGVPNALHQSFLGKEAALRAFRTAVGGDETSVAPAPSFHEHAVPPVLPPHFSSRRSRSRTPPPPFV
ncbi:hypothetical protein B0H11DRAFT_2242771 [Mycena galericulata]|nr:hypothetical protein B0H11DRAFT_2242771 [Mycena galericulata]